MLTQKDILIEGSTYESSLTRLIGKTIKDIRGYISDPYGGGASFKLTKIEFEDGTFLGVEGEHDYPYLVRYGDEQPNYDEETLERLYHDEEEG